MTSQLNAKDLKRLLDCDDEPSAKRPKLSEIKSVLADGTSRQYLKKNIPQFSKLLSNLFKYATEDSETAEMAYDCSVSALQFLVQLLKQQSPKNTLSQVFIQDILFPLSRTLYVKEANFDNKLGAEMHKCLQQVFFSKDAISQFKENENESPILSTLVDKLPTGNSTQHVAIVTKLARTMVTSCKNDADVIDYFFRKLVDTAGERKPSVLNALLSCLTDLALDFDHKIEDVTLNQFLGNIVNEILEKGTLESTEYDVLSNIAILHPLIIEKKINMILERVLLEERSSMEKYKLACEKLMGEIFNLASKLRYEHKLVGWILVAVKKALEKRNNLNHLFLDEGTVDKFSKSLNSLNTNQTIKIFLSILYHLKLDCITEGKFSNATAFMLKVTTDLTVAYIRGVKMFDHTIPLDHRTKFVNHLIELRDALNLLLERIVKNYNNSVADNWLRIAHIYCEVADLMVYYSPNAIGNEVDFSLDKDQLKMLQQKIEDSGDENCRDKMKKLFLYQLKSKYLNEKKIHLKKVSSELQNCWPNVIENYPELIPLLNNSQILELASLALENIELLKRESLRENRTLMMAVSIRHLSNMKDTLKSCQTKDLLELLNAEQLLSSDMDDKEMVQTIAMKKWVQIDCPEDRNVEDSLRLLQSLNIENFHSNVKKIYFLILYSIYREFCSSETLLELCASMMSSLFQESEFPISECIEPMAFFKITNQPAIFSKVIEMSLKNALFNDDFLSLVSEDSYSKENSVALLYCAEKAIAKVNQEQKVVLKTLLTKIVSNILDNCEAPVLDSDELHAVTISLKARMAKGKVKKNLRKLIVATLEHFYVEGGFDQIPSIDNCPMAKAMMRLTAFSIKCKNLLKLNDDILKVIWSFVVQRFLHPDPMLTEALTPYLENEELLLLQDEMIEAIEENDQVLLKKLVLVCGSALKTNVARKKQGAFLEVVHSSFEKVRPGLSQECWHEVLNLARLVISAHQFDINAVSVDFCFRICWMYLNDSKINSCLDILVLCALLIYRKADFVKDRLPIFVQIYSEAIKLVIEESRNKNTTLSTQDLSILMLEVGKIAIGLIKMKKDVVRLSPVLLANLVQWYSQGVIPLCVKEPLDTVIAKFISISDSYTIGFVSRCLPNGDALFKNLLASYKKFHKFKGFC